MRGFSLGCPWRVVAESLTYKPHTGSRGIGITGLLGQFLQVQANLFSSGKVPKEMVTAGVKLDDVCEVDVVGP